MHSDLACLLHDLPAHSHKRPVLPPPPPVQRSIIYPQDWRTHSTQSALFSGPFAPSSWANAGPSQPCSLWPSSPPDFLLPFHHFPSRDHDASGYCLARSDTSSAVSRDSDLSPSPEVAEVVCNAPLVAPIPLPYHSPTFLLYDLPDDDEDLSHPPYTHRPHKRKRTRDEEPDAQSHLDANPAPPKRRSVAEDARHWNAASVGQWAASAAPSSALRHPSTAFSRRNRAR